MPLELTGTEVPVGTFYADILARNPQDDSRRPHREPARADRPHPPRPDHDLPRRPRGEDRDLDRPRLPRAAPLGDPLAQPAHRRRLRLLRPAAPRRPHRRQPLRADLRGRREAERAGSANASPSPRRRGADRPRHARRLLDRATSSATPTTPRSASRSSRQSTRTGSRRHRRRPRRRPLSRSRTLRRLRPRLLRRRRPPRSQTCFAPLAGGSRSRPALGVPLATSGTTWLLVSGSTSPIRPNWAEIIDCMEERSKLYLATFDRPLREHRPMTDKTPVETITHDDRARQHPDRPSSSPSSTTPTTTRSAPPGPAATPTSTRSSSGAARTSPTGPTSSSRPRRSTSRSKSTPRR